MIAKDGVRPCSRGASAASYDLRHTFASTALAAGISLYELSRYMGASVRVLEMHYAHGAGEARRARRRDRLGVYQASAATRTARPDDRKPRVSRVSSEWSVRDLNPWPPACKAGALPAELTPPTASKYADPRGRAA